MNPLPQGCRYVKRVAKAAAKRLRPHPHHVARHVAHRAFWTVVCKAAGVGVIAGGVASATTGAAIPTAPVAPQWATHEAPAWPEGPSWTTALSPSLMPLSDAIPTGISWRRVGATATNAVLVSEPPTWLVLILPALALAFVRRGQS